MEPTIVLILFLTFLVGGMMLALAMGYRSIEESRVGQTLELPHARAETVVRTIAVPSFLPPAGVVPPVPSITFDDALLARLERHVRAEQALVSQFVRFPSVDSLYSRSSTSLRAH